MSSPSYSRVTPNRKASETVPPAQMRKAENATRSKDTYHNRSNCGAKRKQALDPTVERPNPLLVVKRPLMLHVVAHQYVASVFLECKQNRAATCRTLGISYEGLRNYLTRIEAGNIEVGCLGIRTRNQSNAGIPKKPKVDPSGV